MRILTNLLALVIYSNFICAQGVGIGTTTPSSSAKLEISSTTQGFLPPRLSLVERNALSNPVSGLIIYCTTCEELQVYSQGSWKNVSGTTACRFLGQGVPICGQVWMTKNLDVTTYRNGDSIPQETDYNVWRLLTTGAWCWYNNDSVNYAATYGKLYNWYAVNDPRGLAPLGWHIPTDADVSNLVNCLGGDTTVGGRMKEVGFEHWLSPNSGATNISGFTGLPAGNRTGNGLFGLNGSEGDFWTGTPYDTNNALLMSLTFNSAKLSYTNFLLKRVGMSVRCVRD